MKALGYIISKRKIKDVVDFVEVVKSEEEIGDPTKPILYVGYELVKSLGVKFSVLDKRLDVDMFWTFGKTENRVDHERDLERFYEYVLQQATRDIRYYYVNVLILPYTRLKSLLNLINSDDKKYIYVNNNMIYLFHKDYVLGLSLSVMKYVKISSKKVMRRLYANQSNVIFSSNDFLSRKLNKAIQNKQYIIPYFKFLQESDIQQEEHNR